MIAFNEDSDDTALPSFGDFERLSGLATATDTIF